MKTTRAQIEAQRKYDSKNTIQYHLKLNKITDADIIDRLNLASELPGGKQGYIKDLIRRDIEK